MFSFNPLTDEDIREYETRNLLKAGEYPFVVTHIDMATSKTGNAMLVVTLSIADEMGKLYIIKDYLTDKMRFKLKHFCETLGFAEEYRTGNLPLNAVIGKTGSVNLIVEKGAAKPEGGFYRDRNAVKDYIKPVAVKNIQLMQNAAPFNDEINF